MSVHKPALDPNSAEAIIRSIYPEPYRSRVLPRSKRSAHYSDPDVDLIWSPPHARGRITRRDGTPLEPPCGAQCAVRRSANDTPTSFPT